ncbi:hypothetical protein V8F20_007432 [Naviculisporaceae sp. PSN 640]
MVKLFAHRVRVILNQLFLPDKFNCSVWMTGLPRDVTHEDIFNIIDNCGKVYTLHINNPLAKASRKRTAAAKIFFFDTEGLRAYLPSRPPAAATIADPRESFGSVDVPPSLFPTATSGSPRIVNYEYLVAYFSRLFTFELEDVIELSVTEKDAVLEFRFAAYRAQAALAFKTLRRDRRFRRANRGVKVKYAKDPCAFSKVW